MATCSIALLALLLAVASCPSSRLRSEHEDRVVLGEKTVTGLVRRIKGGWSVGDRAFAGRGTLEKIRGAIGKQVKIKGVLVKHRVRCTTPQCRTGKWYYTFEPLTSVEVLAR